MGGIYKVYNYYKKKNQNGLNYPLRHAMCNGREQAPLLISILLDKHHRISSRLFKPTQI